MAKARKWWVADRRPLKVNVSETEPIEEKVEEVIETAGDTVVENEIPEVETVEEVNVQPEEKKAEIKSEIKDKKSAKKEWTEEELAVLPREEMYAVIADIEAGKATIKPRFINQ